MKIAAYEPQYKNAFIQMNETWMREMFAMGEEDFTDLGNVEPYIEAGGQIFFALDDDGAAMACCMVAPTGADGEWEIMKFAAKGMYTGSGAGSACLRACTEHARENGASKILIVSNKKCVHAIHLYKKFGFIEIPFDKERFPYDRVDIAFEQLF